MKIRRKKFKQRPRASVKSYDNYNRIVRNKKDKNRGRKKRNGEKDEIERSDNMEGMEECSNRNDSGKRGEEKKRGGKEKNGDSDTSKDRYNKERNERDWKRGERKRGNENIYRV